MVKITLEVTEELSEKLEKLGDRLPEVLSQSLEQQTLPAHVYRHVLNFLASNPTHQQISEFRPTSEMQERLQRLLAASKSGVLTESERFELDEYERIEHLMVMLKSGSLTFLRDQV
jgi:glutamate-1-semialdehyde aminotransferase